MFILESSINLRTLLLPANFTFEPVCVALVPPPAKNLEPDRCAMFSSKTPASNLSFNLLD